MSAHEPGYVLLEDGSRFEGEALYGDTQALGEAVFNTSHSGYQEILSDPSYRRQIMVFTAPHIGNVGVNAADMESDRVQAAAAVVRTLAPPRSLGAGRHEVTWRGDDARGASVASGSYICRLRIGEESVTRPLTLVR